MHRALYFLPFVLSACASKTAPSEAVPVPPRPDNPAERWNLSDLYATETDWEEAFAAHEARIPEIGQYKGKLGDNGTTLADALTLAYDLDKELSRLYSYAGKRSDEDLREAHTLELKQRVMRLYTDFSEAISYIDPELLTIGAEKVKRFIADEPRLANYAHSLDDTLRRAPHTLDAAGEQLLASSQLISDAPSTLYSILSNANIPWPTITLSDGTTVRLNQAAYTKHRAAPNRTDRIAVFEAFWGKWKEYEQTLGVALYAQLKKDLFYTRARKYDSSLARSLGAYNVPDAVYHTLVKATNDNLATLHRYFRLRGRMLGIDDLRYHDIYPSMVDTELTYPIEEGKRLVLNAVTPLGEDYVNTVKKGFSERWMDTYPREGKRSGAYSSGGAYDVHPFVLMNYNDDYESVSTLAHEWGHTMHSYLTNATQPYPDANYSIFVAEVASTFNEGLLLDRVLKDAKSDQERLYYLGSALEGLRGTFFRQAMFAEFELAIHELVGKGEALSGERLTKLYGEILRRYHGHDQGILTIDDAYTMEWAYIPHFYYNFYVYQYATSLAAGSLFVKDVLDGKQGARDRYLAVLSAGNSQYPYDLLKEAGVDLATAAPYEALVARMNMIMDYIEGLLETQ